MERESENFEKQKKSRFVDLVLPHPFCASVISLFLATRLG